MLRYITLTLIVLPPFGQLHSQTQDVAKELEILFESAALRMLPSTARISPDPSSPLSRTLMRSEDGRESESRGLEQPDEELQVGSAVVMSSDGLLLTNAHVISSLSNLLVILHDGRTFPGEVVGVDDVSDVAVVRLVGLEEKLPVPEFATQELRLGQWALALGAPYGLENSLSVGIVSAKERRGLILGQIVDFIQVTTPLHPGNSGGPLFDIEGRLIGINTMVRGMNTGLGFAIPAAQAWEIGKRLARDGQIRRPWLGVRVLDPAENRDLLAPYFPPEIRGALVELIERSGPAKDSGLMPFDLIVELDGRKIQNPAELISEVGRREVGKLVMITVLRAFPDKAAQRMQFEVRLEAPYSSADSAVDASKARESLDMPWDELGLVVENLRPSMQGAKSDGVIVKDVEDGSQAAAQGLVKGSVILSLNLSAVHDVKSYRAALQAARKTGGRIHVIFSSKGTTQFAVIDLEADGPGD